MHSDPRLNASVRRVSGAKEIGFRCQQHLVLPDGHARFTRWSCLFAVPPAVPSTNIDVKRFNVFNDLHVLSVGLITQRTQVQILSPQPTHTTISHSVTFRSPLKSKVLACCVSNANTVFDQRRIPRDQSISHQNQFCGATGGAKEIGFRCQGNRIPVPTTFGFTRWSCLFYPMVTPWCDHWVSGLTIC